jgi:ribosomal protein S18 acetylase RimI-like enzyme
MAAGEAWLIAQGCPKLNLQVRRSNLAAVDFYSALGYGEDDVVSLGKRLTADAPPAG